MTVDLNLSLDFESDQNRSQNLESEFKLTMTNQFGDPNRLSLLMTQHNLLFSTKTIEMADHSTRLKFLKDIIFFNVYSS